MKNNETSVPGKIFILGEYLALLGKPVLAAAVGPRFSMRTYVDPHSSLSPQPALDEVRSPVGLLKKWALSRGIAWPRFEFRDPHQGMGGFGGSTAEFALAYRALFEGESSWLDAWKTYRELFKDASVPPSGADLVVQWSGGVQSFIAEKQELQDFSKTVDWSRLMVFSAAHLPGRKVKTHEHLQSLADQGFPETQSWQRLIGYLNRVIQRSFSTGPEEIEKSLGSAMNEYADFLFEAGLENPDAHQDRLSFRKIEGVSGVKGGGALLADSVLVWVDHESAKQRVLSHALNLGLKLISYGLEMEQGITSCQM